MALDYDSSLLTTMNTPIGRFRWTRLPFGIKCAPELYQRTMNEMLEGIDGAFAIMDDILIVGKDTEHHDQILKQVLRRAQQYNLRLNFDKMRIRKTEVKYVGHLITSKGLKPDPEKVKAIKEMPEPQTKEEVKRFLGFVQYLAKFLPMLSDIEGPLRELTKEKILFHWDLPQQRAWDHLKKLCSEAPVLAYYDVNMPVLIQCDASKEAVGAVLLQENKPVAYASRKLRSSEIGWSPIEKEMLAIQFSTEKFRQYIAGKETVVQTDHKPLENIFRKPLQSTPLRLQTMLFKMKGYDLRVEYIPGKKQFIADALSRASVIEPDTTDPDPDLQVFMVDRISVAPTRYAEIQSKTANELNELYSVIQTGWPDTRQEVPQRIRPYWNVREELAVMDGIIYRGMRIVIPPSLRAGMLERIHEGHLGVVKCKQKAKDALYWPQMGADIECKVSACAKCQEQQPNQQKEPMILRRPQELPWEMVGSDLFHLLGKNYILTIDYFSKDIEVSELKDLTTETTIEALKGHFAKNGIPKVLRTDNGPQYSSTQFGSFAEEWNFQHQTSSPRYPQSNGEAEAAVKIVKSLWKKNQDKQKSLLMYRSTPIPSLGASPAQLNMGRRLRTTLPMSTELLQPETISRKDIQQKLLMAKTKQKQQYDKHAKPQQPLYPGQQVRVQTEPSSSWKQATVIRHHEAPRSYVIETDSRTLRRNRSALRVDHTPRIEIAQAKYTAEGPLISAQCIPEDAVATVPQGTGGQRKATPTPSGGRTVEDRGQSRQDAMTGPAVSLEKTTITRSGRVSRKPQRLDL